MIWYTLDPRNMSRIPIQRRDDGNDFEGVKNRAMLLLVWRELAFEG